jgi:hypothetical protein
MRDFFRDINGVEQELGCIDPTHHKQVMKDANRRMWKDSRLRVWFVLFIIILTTVSNSAVERIHALFPSVPYSVRFALTTAVSGLFGIVGAWLLRARRQRAVREVLRARGVRVCMKCGYNLSGIVSEQCPECGSTAI